MKTITIFLDKDLGSVKLGKAKFYILSKVDEKNKLINSEFGEIKERKKEFLEQEQIIETD